MADDFRVRRWRVFFAVLIALAITGVSGWTWLDRPLMRLRCEGGQRPERAEVLVTFTGLSMSGEYSQLWLTREGARTYNLQHEDAEVELTGAELEALYERVERPSPAPTDLGRSEADVAVYLTCDGETTIRRFSATAGRNKNDFESWRIDPTRIERLIAAARNELNDRDPRTRKVYAVAWEVVAICHSPGGRRKE